MIFTSAAFVGLALIGYGLAVWTGMIRDVFLDAKMAFVIGAVIFVVGGGLHLIAGKHGGSFSLSKLNPVTAITHGVTGQEAGQTENALVGALDRAVSLERSHWRRSGRYLRRLGSGSSLVKLTVSPRGRRDLVIVAASTGKTPAAAFAVRLHKGRLEGTSCSGVNAILYTSRCQNGHFSL